jgi:hypothetical protein
MTMRTDDLIRTLSTDSQQLDRSVGVVLLWAVILVSPISLLIFFGTLGLRENFVGSLGNPFFDLKFPVTLSVAVAAVSIGLILTRPGRRLGGRVWLMGIPLALVGTGIVADFMVPQKTTWMARLVGSSSRACVIAIPVLGLPLLVASIVALRHGASTRPALTGAFAGMFSAGLAAALYATHCLDDSPLFVATWYTLAIALMTAIGALAGQRFLKI